MLHRPDYKADDRYQSNRNQKSGVVVLLLRWYCISGKSISQLSSTRKIISNRYVIIFN
jgi:hypothetical protein